MPETIEYRVKPVTRYIVTEFVSDEDVGRVSQIGEFDNEEDAWTVAQAMAASFRADPPEIDVSDDIMVIDAEGVIWFNHGGDGWSKEPK